MGGTRNMVYRAKFTKIQAWVESHYNINAYNIVKDLKDVYIELHDPDEADLLEAINKAQSHLLSLKLQWYDKFNHEL